MKTIMLSFLVIVSISLANAQTFNYVHPNFEKKNLPNKLNRNAALTISVNLMMNHF